MANKTKEEFIAAIKQSPERLKKLGDILDFITKFRIACLNWNLCYRHAQEQDFYDICRSGWEAVYQIQQNEFELLNCYPKSSLLPLFKASKPTINIKEADEKNGLEWLSEWGAALELTGLCPEAGEFCKSFIQILRTTGRKRLDGWNKLRKPGDVDKFYSGIDHLSFELYHKTLTIAVGFDAKANPELRLMVILCSLRLFRQMFVKFVAVEGPYDSEDKTLWFSHEDDTNEVGTLTLEPQRGVVDCCFNAPGYSRSYTITLEGWEKYEKRLFETWNYINGEYIGNDKLDGQAVWIVKNAASFETNASEIEDHAKPLLDEDRYKDVIPSVLSIIRNGSPKWNTHNIEWAYVRNLDEVIKKLKTKADFASTEQDESQSAQTRGDRKGSVGPPVWLRVQKRVDNHWKNLQAKGVTKFPSLRSLAKELEENAGTVKKAIQYSKSLSYWYNKYKSTADKVKYIDPSKLDYVDRRHKKEKGKVGVEYLTERKELLNQIKEKAQELIKSPIPDKKNTGNVIIRCFDYIDNTRNNDELQDMFNKLKNYDTSPDKTFDELLKQFQSTKP